jgi:hypothetical protein
MSSWAVFRTRALVSGALVFINTINRDSTALWACWLWNIDTLSYLATTFISVTLCDLSAGITVGVDWHGARFVYAFVLSRTAAFFVRSVAFHDLHLTRGTFDVFDLDVRACTLIAWFARRDFVGRTAFAFFRVVFDEVFSLTWNERGFFAADLGFWYDLTLGVT